jgi:hypothetical protein
MRTTVIERKTSEGVKVVLDPDSASLLSSCWVELFCPDCSKKYKDLRTGTIHLQKAEWNCYRAVSYAIPSNLIGIHWRPAPTHGRMNQDIEELECSICKEKYDLKEVSKIVKKMMEERVNQYVEKKLKEKDLRI